MRVRKPRANATQRINQIPIKAETYSGARSGSHATGFTRITCPLRSNRRTLYWMRARDERGDTYCGTCNCQRTRAGARAKKLFYGHGYRTSARVRTSRTTIRTGFGVPGQRCAGRSLPGFTLEIKSFARPRAPLDFGQGFTGFAGIHREDLGGSLDSENIPHRNAFLPWAI